VPLSVAFDPPKSGWIGIRLTAPEGELAERFSYVYSSLEQLCVAVCDAAQGIQARPAILLLEPVEVELRFAPCGADDTELTVSLFPDARRVAGRRPTSALIHRGRTRDMVRAFWRALRRLETSVPEEAFAREWRSPFPALEMSALTRVVDSWRVERDDQPL
jgi:hypothetical protein